MFRIINNVETGEITQVELTQEEIEQLQKEQLELEEKQAARQAEASIKAANRQALLDKLGITEEEARLLLGGN